MAVWNVAEAVEEIFSARGSEIAAVIMEPVLCVMDPKNWTRNRASLSSGAALTMKESRCPEPVRTIRRA